MLKIETNRHLKKERGKNKTKLPDNSNKTCLLGLTSLSELFFNGKKDEDTRGNLGDTQACPAMAGQLSFHQGTGLLAVGSHPSWISCSLC